MDQRQFNQAYSAYVEGGGMDSRRGFARSIGYPGSSPSAPPLNSGSTEGKILANTVPQYFSRYQDGKFRKGIDNAGYGQQLKPSEAQWGEIQAMGGNLQDNYRQWAAGRVGQPGWQREAAAQLRTGAAPMMVDWKSKMPQAEPAAPAPKAEG